MSTDDTRHQPEPATDPDDAALAPDATAPLPPTDEPRTNTAADATDVADDAEVVEATGAADDADVPDDADLVGATDAADEADVVDDADRADDADVADDGGVATGASADLAAEAGGTQPLSRADETQPLPPADETEVLPVADETQVLPAMTKDRPVRDDEPAVAQDGHTRPLPPSQDARPPLIDELASLSTPPPESRPAPASTPLPVSAPLPAAAPSPTPATSGTSATVTSPAVTEPEKEPRARLRVGTVVWGLVLAAIGVGILAWASGLAIDLQLALIVLLAVAGAALLVGSLLSAARSSRQAAA
ncbi:hypothetical protein HGA02_18760, partial [Cellulomonas septica]|nr:hypothetical protein [Cellulomonas septica]